MKRLMILLLSLQLLFGGALAVPAAAADNFDRYGGIWQCRVTTATLLDMNDLRRQMDVLSGTKTTDEQWNQVKGPLTQNHVEALEELKNSPFEFEIYEMYNGGIKADVIATDGTRTTSVETTSSSDGYVFRFDRFLGSAVGATMNCRVRETNGTIKGNVEGETKVSEGGLNLTMRSALQFEGLLKDPKKPPSGVEIVDANGNSTESATLEMGKDVTFNYLIYPADFDPAQVTRVEWYVNDPKIARVDNNGRVTPLTTGETRLAVWLNGDYSLTDTIEITVVPKGTAAASSSSAPKPPDAQTPSGSSLPAASSAPAASASDLPGLIVDRSDEKDKTKENDSAINKVMDFVEKPATVIADLFSKASRLLPNPEVLGKIPLIDLLVFGYEVDKDMRENQAFGDAPTFAEQKAFWGNVVGAGPIGAVPKALDAILEVSKQFGWDFDFSFEKTIKGASNFVLDMFGSNSNVDVPAMRERHLKNHYGVLGGFGAWVSSAIYDVSQWGSGVARTIEETK